MDTKLHLRSESILRSKGTLDPSELVAILRRDYIEYRFEREDVLLEKLITLSASSPLSRMRRAFGNNVEDSAASSTSSSASSSHTTCDFPPSHVNTHEDSSLLTSRKTSTIKYTRNKKMNTMKMNLEND